MADPRPSSDSTGLRVQGVSKAYGAQQVLHDVSFTAPRGTITGLVGPNGSGKTTLLRCILGLTPCTGATTFDGEPLSAHPVPGRFVGAVLDPSAHSPQRTVRQMLRVAATYTRSEDRVDECIERFGLASVRHRRFERLSLGMKQRAALAVAFLGQPRFLLFDEPMNGLDVDAGQWLARTLRQAADAGATVIVSSHLLNELQTMVDQAVIISRGEITYSGPPTQQSALTLVSPVPEQREVLVAALRAAGHTVGEPIPGAPLRVTAEPAVISALCLAHGIVLTLLAPQERQLVDLYKARSEGEFLMGGDPR